MSKKVKIGITGGSGVLGSLLKKKLDINKNKLKVFRGDVSKKNLVFKWIRHNQFDILIHLAAIVPTTEVEKNYSRAIKVNYGGTKNLIEAIKKFQKKKIYIFFSSTSHIYNFSNKILDENSPYFGLSKYGKTKILAEKILRKYSSIYDLCIGRISSLTSEKQKRTSFLTNLIGKLKERKNIFFDNANIYRNFIHAEDVCNIVHILVKKKFTGIVNITNNEKVKFSDLFKYLNQKFGNLIVYDLKEEEKLLLSNKILKNSITFRKPMNIKKIVNRLI